MALTINRHCQGNWLELLAQNGLLAKLWHPCPSNPVTDIGMAAMQQLVIHCYQCPGLDR